LNETPYRHIAARYGTSTGALQRHREHLPSQLVKAREAEAVTQADTLLERLKELNAETKAVLADAKLEGNGNLRLLAIARLEKQLELEGKLIGELQSGPVVNIYSAPEWLTLRAVVIAALHPYPDAARAVSRALTAGER
jgi:hypothetical protein